MASVGAIERCYDWLTSDDGKKIVRRAWAKCTVKQHNLSAEWFTDPSSVPTLISYLQTHPELYQEIKSKIGCVPGVDTEPVKESADFEHDDSPEHNNTDVPMRAVVRKALGLDLASCNSMDSTFCVEDRVVQADSDGDLHAVSTAEQIFDLHMDSDDMDSDSVDSEALSA